MKKNAHITPARIKNCRVDRESRMGGAFHCDSPTIKSDKQYLWLLINKE